MPSSQYVNVLPLAGAQGIEPRPVGSEPTALPLCNAPVAVPTRFELAISSVTGRRELQLPYGTDSVHLRTPAGEHVDSAPQEERRHDRSEPAEAKELAGSLLVQDDFAAKAAFDADDLLGLGVGLLGDELELLEDVGGTPP